MTLKLVSDNVTELEVYNFQDIADCARRFADQLEAGEQGEPFRVVVIIQDEDSLALSVWGDNANHHELMGVFEAAKLRTFADQMIDDE